MKSTTKIINAQLNNEFSSDEIIAIGKKAMEEAAAITWKQAEVGRTLTQNDKIALVDDQTLVIGADIGSDKHDIVLLTIGGGSSPKRPLNLRTMKQALKRQRNGSLG